MPAERSTSGIAGGTGEQVADLRFLASNRRLVHPKSPGGTRGERGEPDCAPQSPIVHLAVRGGTNTLLAHIPAAKAALFPPFIAERARAGLGATQIRAELERDLTGDGRSHQLLAGYDNRAEVHQQRGMLEGDAALQAAWETRIATGVWPPEPLGGEQLNGGARPRALDPNARPVFDLTDLSRSKLDEADRLRRQQR